MNYIGSKLKLSGFIIKSMKDTVGNLDDKIFAELFAGTGIVSRKLKNEVAKIIVNDIEPYSYILNRNYIGNTKRLNYEKHLNQLNALEGIAGFIYSHYCHGGGKGRKYFSDENGKKIDAIRTTIELWKNQSVISDDEYYFLLATLLESADAIANTASVYGAFLKKIKKSAQVSLILKPALFTESQNKHEVYQSDVNELVKKIAGDILYLDPPYNHRQYGANYHLLNTIGLYDDFIPKGKTGMRDYYKSPYCQRSKISKVFEDLIAHAKFQYIFVSYNNEGLMPEKEVKRILSKYGSYNLSKMKYQRFKADKTENRHHKATSTFEHLHVLIKE